MRTSLLLLAFVFFSATLVAQDRPVRKGFWGSFEIEKSYAGIERNSALKLSEAPFDKFVVTSMALGFHINPRWSGAIGLQIAPHSLNPEKLPFNRIHFDVLHRPSQSWRSFALQWRLVLPITHIEAQEHSTRFYLSMGAGFDLRRLIGNVGVFPSVGIGYCDYQFMKPANAQPTDPALQRSFFFGYLRLAVTIN